jgi:hypothetical protein
MLDDVVFVKEADYMDLTAELTTEKVEPDHQMRGASPSPTGASLDRGCCQAGENVSCDTH